MQTSSLGSSGQILKVNVSGNALEFADPESTSVVVNDSNANSDFPIVFHNGTNGLLDDTGSFFL